MTMELCGVVEVRGGFSGGGEEVVVESVRLMDGVASLPVSVEVLVGESLVERVDSSRLAGWAGFARMLLNKRHRQSRAPARGYPVTLIADTISGWHALL